MFTQRELPPGIKVIPTLDGARYILPRRDLGKGRWVGLVVVLFGGVITAFMLFWMGMPISGAIETDGPMRWFLLLFGLLGLPGLLIGLGFLVAGIALLLNISHSEIVVTRDRIWAVERAGPIRWRRKRNVGRIKRLLLTHGVEAAGQEQTGTLPVGPAFLGIRAEGDGMRPLLLAPGYPRPLIEPLAETLADRLEAGGRPLPVEDAPRRDEGREPEEGPEREAPRPTDTKILHEQLPNGFTLTVPPAGLWKGSKGLFFFGLLWTGFMIVFGVFALWGNLADKDPDGPVWLFGLFIAVFFAVGIGVLLSAINMGRRRVLLARVGDAFAWRRIGPFGSKEQRYRIEELAAVRVGPSGMKVNDVPVMELQILLRNGKTLGLMSQLRNDELSWIAHVLRHELNLPQRPRL